jgi:hypothetical protein
VRGSRDETIDVNTKITAKYKYEVRSPKNLNAGRSGASRDPGNERAAAKGADDAQER